MANWKNPKTSSYEYEFDAADDDGDVGDVGDGDQRRSGLEFATIRLSAHTTIPWRILSHILFLSFIVN